MSRILFALALSFCILIPVRSQDRDTVAETSRKATVLLITATELKDAWKPFAEWKTRLGKSTKIVTVEEIGKKYKGDDVQQKIRACVLAHIKSDQTRWVILGGDAKPGGKGLVPDRDTVHTVQGYKDIPTDLYYISEKSWDADGDGVYGEWKDDKEEIAYTNPAGTSIGRIPMRTAEDVKAYTAKVIAYETRYPEKDFAKKFVYTNTTAGSEPKVKRSWDDYISPAWKDGKVIRFFHTETPWDEDDPGDYDLVPDSWVKMINDRTAGKMHMHGHGFLPGWVLEKRKIADAGAVEKLTNKDAYLVMTTVSCFTGQYESRKDPCIAESMLRAPEAGAVVIVAPSREGVPIFHKRSDFRKMVTEGKLDGTTKHHTNFWKYGLSENLTAGEAFMKAKELMAGDARKTAGYHWCECELTFLGDPTLDLRASDPFTPKVKFPRSIQKGSSRKITIDAGKKGLTVCLWKGDEVYEVAVTDEKGKVQFTASPKTAGELLLTVSGPSVNVFTETIRVK